MRRVGSSAAAEATSGGTARWGSTGVALHTTVIVGACAVGALSAVLHGCATEEIPLYGDPEEVVGASSSSSSSGGGGAACEPDPDCDTSFRDDVFPVLRDQGACGAAPCHAEAIAGFAFPADPATARTALLAYVFQGSSAYVVPCDPDASKMLCNMHLADGETSPYEPCGSPMPKGLQVDDVDDAPLSLAQLEAIAAWIECGAPDN